MDLRVILADRHSSVRAAIRSLLAAVEGVTLGGEATNATEALELLRAQRPDVAVLDVRLPGLSPPELVERAWGLSPDTAIVLLAMHAEAHAMGDLGRSVAALVAKEAAGADLPAAMHAIARGQTFASASLGAPPELPVRPIPSTEHVSGA